MHIEIPHYCMKQCWEKKTVNYLPKRQYAKKNSTDEEYPIQRCTMGKQLVGKILMEFCCYLLGSPHICNNLFLGFSRLHADDKVVQQIVFYPPFSLMR